MEFLPFLGVVGDSVVVLAFEGLEGDGGALVTVISSRGEDELGTSPSASYVCHRTTPTTITTVTAPSSHRYLPLLSLPFLPLCFDNSGGRNFRLIPSLDPFRPLSKFPERGLRTANQLEQQL